MSYTQSKAVADSRRHLKDNTQNIWTDDDIKQFVNDAIDLIKQAVPLYFVELNRVPYIDSLGVESTDINIDAEYELLIPLFVAARCFEQDEQHYRATQKMNEFETRLSVMSTNILESDAYAKILDELGATGTDVIRDVYFNAVTDSETPVGLL